MRTLIGFMWGFAGGLTIGGIWIACSEDKLYEAAIEERSQRLLAESKQHDAERRANHAEAELDVIRRNWMRNRIDWGIPPADEVERIPAAAVPLVVVPTPEQLGIELK